MTGGVESLDCAAKVLGRLLPRVPAKTHDNLLLCYLNDSLRMPYHSVPQGETSHVSVTVFRCSWRPELFREFLHEFSPKLAHELPHMTRNLFFGSV
jgi:hypothetical protein